MRNFPYGGLSDAQQHMLFVFVQQQRPFAAAFLLAQMIQHVVQISRRTSDGTKNLKRMGYYELRKNHHCNGHAF